MQWDGIVNLRTNPGTGQILAQRIAPSSSQCVLVVDVETVRLGDGSLEFGDGAEKLRVAFSVAPTGRSPRIKMPEFHQ